MILVLTLKLDKFDLRNSNLWFINSYLSIKCVRKEVWEFSLQVHDYQDSAMHFVKHQYFLYLAVTYRHVFILRPILLTPLTTALLYLAFTYGHVSFSAANFIDIIDDSVDPCNNFYQFVCGAWKRKNVLPAGKSYYDVIEKRREVDNILMKGECSNIHNTCRTKIAMTTKKKKRKPFHTHCTHKRRYYPSFRMWYLNLL